MTTRHEASSATPMSETELYHPALDGPVPPASEIGGKAHHLGRLADAGVQVPRWFAIPVANYARAVVETGSDAEDPAALHRALLTRAFPTWLAEPLSSALRGSGLEGRRLAVRSSAVAEDAASSSFAGQFDTVLNVNGSEAIQEAILRVWASAANPHALAYGGSTAMAVIVQEMVDAEVSGVAFGADPLTGDPSTLVISAVPGLGEGLVSGALEADTWRLREQEGRLAVVGRSIVGKREAVRPDPRGGTRTVEVPNELAAEPVLTDDEVIRVAGAVRSLGTRFGAPQDVEWLMTPGSRSLRILQTRPITTLTGADERRLWDNSNIVESYSGITLPLTFTFALAVYDDVYRQFCAVVGVDPARIDRNRHVFANMLGLMRGRVYYNLHNWYRVLALLPGFAINRAFMERMMGVSEKLAEPPALEGSAGRFGDAVAVGRMVSRLIGQHRRLGSDVPAFHAHVRSVLEPLADVELQQWDADRLLALYRRLENELLRRWQAPLVNDFFAMIWFGLLGRLVESWLPGEPATLVNDLLTHEGGIVSTEPARRVAMLAESARGDEALLGLLESEQAPERVLAALAEEFPPFYAELRGYLAEFGDRSANELKLETVTMRDDPGLLLGAIRGYLTAGVPSAPTDRDAGLRSAAEARVRGRLGAVRRRLFAIVLSNARARVRDRENLRFERTRVFGIVRRIFLGFGHQLTRVGKLDEPRDIFFLRMDEVFAHVDGTSTSGDLRALVALRRAEWEGFRDGSPPPSRFESIGPPELGRWIARGVAAEAPIGEDGALQGVGCCAGIVRAPVQVVRDPDRPGALDGRILVAEHTDPGWTLLFPRAKGILVERGSLLSHSAIVAREMGIPCVVAVPHLLATLQDGEEVEMDGAAGTIRRLGLA